MRYGTGAHALRERLNTHCGRTRRTTEFWGSEPKPKPNVGRQMLFTFNIHSTTSFHLTRSWTHIVWLFLISVSIHAYQLLVIFSLQPVPTTTFCFRPLVKMSLIINNDGGEKLPMSTFNGSPDHIWLFKCLSIFFRSLLLNV